VLNSGDAGDYYRKILRSCGTTQLHPETAAYLERVRSGVVSGRKYSDVLLDWQEFRENALAFMNRYDLLISPVCSDVAPEHGRTSTLDFSYAYYYNLLGWPVVVVRAGSSPQGLPIGVQIAGRPWQDHQVLAAAHRVEQVLGGYKRDFPEQPLLPT
jgi:amidase